MTPEKRPVSLRTLHLMHELVVELEGEDAPFANSMERDLELKWMEEEEEEEEEIGRAHV